MGRFNWMTRALCAFSVILHVSSASRAFAYDLNDASLDSIKISAQCTIIKYLIPSTGLAIVAVDVPGEGDEAAGGSYWKNGDAVTIFPLITTESLETCLGSESGTVTNLAQNGADATSFASQKTMGFSFTLTTDAGNLTKGYHEYYLIATPTSPTVTLTSDANDPQSGLFTVTATFSETMTGLTADGIVVVNGTKGALSGSGTTYTIKVTPDNDGPVTVNVAAGVAQDAAGNGNTAATQLSVTTDATAPTVVLTSDATDPQSGLFTVTATFDEAVTGFEPVDISLNNATASNFIATSATVYTFKVTPGADGAVTVDVAAGVAQDAAGNGNVIASQLSVTTDGTAPTVTITGPTDVVTEDFTVTFTFSEGVTGFTADDVTVTNGTKGAFAETTSGSVYTLVITPELGTTVSVSVAADTAEDAAGNGNEASTTFTVTAGSPASYFAEHEAEIKAIITQDATRSLTSTLSANQRMTRGARSRFIESRDQGEGDGAGFTTRNNVPFDVDGTFDLDGARLSSKGTFFGQTGNVEGTERRLVFGEFDVQRDGNTNSATATLTARMAWERVYTDSTMLGYFVGGELAQSNIKGSFEGDQNRLGVSFGGYIVHQLDERVFLDGFITAGAGRNTLKIADDVLALNSNYNTRTATIGAAVSGVYEYGQYEFRPELAFNYGKTWIGDVGFTGVAYGLTDNALSLDAGNVSIANLTLRPVIVWALDAKTVADSNAQLSFAPRFICERTTTATTTQNCGAGAEIGLSSNSEDGLSSANIRFVMDRVGNSNRSSVVLNLEHRF